MGIAGEEISDDVPVADDLNGMGEPAGGQVKANCMIGAIPVS
jgi:hypothetical protein